MPPERVVCKQSRTVASPRRRIISHVLPPSSEAGAGDTKSVWGDTGTRPLVVIGNNRSGNSDSAALLAGFRRLLNPGQVINLADSRMEEALEWCSLTHPTQCVVLACGGDGTVRLVLCISPPKCFVLPTIIFNIKYFDQIFLYKLFSFFSIIKFFSWLLNVIDKMELSTPPAVAIFPLGTGNDLARALGYGSGSDASADISQFLDNLGIILSTPQ